MGTRRVSDGAPLHLLGRGRQPRRDRHRDVAAVDGLDEFGRSVIAHRRGARYGSCGDVQSLGRVSAGDMQICISSFMLIITVL
jgi:hypothetical protein